MNVTRAIHGRALLLLCCCASCSGQTALSWDDSRSAGGATAAPGGSTSGGTSAGSGAATGGASAAGGVDPEPKGGRASNVPAGAASGASAGGGDGGAPEQGHGGASGGFEPCRVECCGSRGVSDDALRIIADSERGFSGMQGQCGWSYGYLEAGAEPFKLLTTYNTTEYDSPVWELSTEHPPWLAIFARTQHPNQVPLLWVDRRWTSSVSGKVSLRGHVAMTDPTDAGNGVVASVRVAGAEVWSTTLAFDDVIGKDFDLSVEVTVGTAVDFIVAPGGGDAYDSTELTVVIAE